MNGQTETEAELVRRLVVDQHLNVVDRAQLPNGLARGRLVVAAVLGEVQRTGGFPAGVDPEGGYVGAVIQASRDGVVVHWRVEAGVARVATAAVERYATALQASEAVARREWPRDIDGVPIDWQR